MSKKLRVLIAMTFVVSFLIVKFAWDRRIEAGILAIKTGDGPTVIDRLTLTAHLGHRTSQQLLANVYACENVGIAYNPEKALFWLSKFLQVQDLKGDKANIKAAADCLKRN
jgi:hypothetical protein